MKICRNLKGLWQVQVYRSLLLREVREVPRCGRLPRSGLPIGVARGRREAQPVVASRDGSSSRWSGSSADILSVMAPPAEAIVGCHRSKDEEPPPGSAFKAWSQRSAYIGRSTHRPLGVDRIDSSTNYHATLRQIKNTRSDELISDQPKIVGSEVVVI